MADDIISNPSEWMSNPSKFFINIDSSNLEEQVNIDNELTQDISESYTGDILGYARTLIKAIVIARQKGILPDEIDKKINSPEDVAKLATEGAIMADTLLKLATGDIDTYEKLANRILDTTHVLAVSSVEIIVQKGLPLAENALSAAAETIGQAFGCPGVGETVQQLFDVFAPALRNRARAILIAGCNKLNEWFNQAKNQIFDMIREHREMKEKEGELSKREKNSHKQTKSVTSFA